MKRGQIFVRAKSPKGIWGSHDVLDLTQESLNTFVIDMLFRAGHLTGLKDEMIPGNHIQYESTVEVEPLPPGIVVKGNNED